MALGLSGRAKGGVWRDFQYNFLLFLSRARLPLFRNQATFAFQHQLGNPATAESHGRWRRLLFVLAHPWPPRTRGPQQWRFAINWHQLAFKHLAGRASGCVVAIRTNGRVHSPALSLLSLLQSEEERPLPLLTCTEARRPQPPMPLCRAAALPTCVHVLSQRSFVRS